ncbi:carbohydrate ABC transporter [Streptomyces sp. S1A1-8]|jgi:hypothetical protein|nr:carbohydrate ABC transporter [Streptomyces sp. S1D4-20]QDO04620.1 carbohydrate ABC transporter [Streptomyces sp. RLB1-9]QDO26409.1 carbohydrate ABC transporter [Streptomyces sp. S1A1-8]QDO36519.1 carbohydrate ABC transporter [Streptomyces sp. S1A1-3]
MPARPLTKEELRKQRSREYLMRQQQRFIDRHGEDLGVLYFVLMLLQTHGSKAYKRGDVQSLRLLAHDLNAIYTKHTA